MNFSRSGISALTLARPSWTAVQGVLDRISVVRLPRRQLTIKRLFVGGRLTDLGRLPRYAAFFLIGTAFIWAPITGYLKTAPLRYSSGMSLILPGSGASASVNLNEIGQASSFASSAFSNNSVSPTETYKRLISADRILDAAADGLGVSRDMMGKPKITLVDQTGLIHVEMTGGSADQARAFSSALLAAFFQEIDALRSDELNVRENSGTGAIQDYVASVRDTRAAISALQAESGLISAEQFREQIAANDQLVLKVRDLRADLEHQSAKLKRLETTLGLSTTMAALTLKLYADARYLALLDSISKSEAELAKAQSHYGPRHPAVQNAKESRSGALADAFSRAVEVTGLISADMKLLDRAPTGERAELLSEMVREDVLNEGLAMQFASLSERLASDTERLLALAPIAAELEDKQRDFNVAEAVFASAIARTQSTKTDVYASYPLVQVLENPSLPDTPSSPRRKLAAVAGFAATFMLLIGLVLGWVRAALINKLLSRPQERTEA